MAGMAGIFAEKKKLPIWDALHGSLPFDLEVRYGPLEELVKDGSYDAVDKSIFLLSAVPARGPQTMQAHFINRPGTLTDGHELASRWHGLRHATIEELLAVGRVHPEVQNHFPIVAFGSAVKVGQQPGVWLVPYLAGKEQRRLCMGQRDFAFSDVFRFLSVQVPR
jgi:hypothetical protein